MTGMGVVSPLGGTPESFFASLMAGVSAVRPFRAYFADHLAMKVAVQVDFEASQHFSVRDVRGLDRTAQMALVAAKRAWDDAALTVLSAEEQLRAAVYMGTGLGGAGTIDDVSRDVYVQDVRRVHPFSVPKIMCNAPASHISMRFGIRGASLTYSIACSSSAVALGEAARAIRFGAADIVLAGGTESMLTRGSIKGWESLGVLAVPDPADPAAACKPFAKDRTGFVLGEGAAVLILEEMERARARGARIYGELAGYGVTSDASHITIPTVEGQAAAVIQALADAGLEPCDIGYINAHGTATTANDLVETATIRRVFGAHADAVPVSSTKSMHGHLLGAGGAVEFLVTLLALRHGAIPPTINLHVPDPECDLDYVPNVGRTGLPLRAAMSQSFAFGGTNAVLVARRCD